MDILVIGFMLFINTDCTVNSDDRLKCSVSTYRMEGKEQCLQQAEDLNAYFAGAAAPDDETFHYALCTAVLERGGETT